MLLLFITDNKGFGDDYVCTGNYAITLLRGPNVLLVASLQGHVALH